MPTFSLNTFSSYFKRILQFGHSGNTGTPTATTNIESGDGVKTAISLSDDVLFVQPQNDNTGTTLAVRDISDSTVFSVSTSSGATTVGSSQVNALTFFKEMGLYEFSPNTQGYHYPLIANTMFGGVENFTYDDDWGVGTDPATTLDVSGLTDPENAIAVYWYIAQDIVLDVVRFMEVCDTASHTLNFHIYSYAIDTTTNFGDLSGGTVHASGTVETATGAIKTGTLTLDNANIAGGRVIIGFVEDEDGTADLSLSFNIRYHIT